MNTKTEGKKEFNLFNFSYDDHIHWDYSDLPFSIRLKIGLGIILGIPVNLYCQIRNKIKYTEVNYD